MRPVHAIVLSLFAASAALAAKPAPKAAKKQPPAKVAPLPEDWTTRSELPLLSVPRKPDPAALYKAPRTPPPAPTFANDSEAERAALDFLAKRFGKPSATLVLDKAVRTTSGYLVRFKANVHGILLRGGGAEVAFVGKTPSGAYQLVSEFTVQPKSESKIVAKDAAASALETAAPERKAELATLQLVYVFAPENLKAAGDRKEDVYTPQWTFERGGPAVDAYTGAVAGGP